MIPKRVFWLTVGYGAGIGTSLYATRKEKMFFIVADGLVRYGEVMKIIDIAAGLNLRISLVTEGMLAAARQK